jgi:hypothetical protein
MADKFVGVPIAAETARANDGFQAVKTNGVFEYSPQIWLLEMAFRTDQGEQACTARKGKAAGWAQNPQLMEAVLADLKLPEGQRRRWEIEYETKSETSGDRTFVNNYVCGFRVISTVPTGQSPITPTTTLAPAPAPTASVDYPPWMAVEINPVANSIRRAVAYKGAADKITEILRVLLSKVEEPADNFIERISPLLREVSALEYELTNEAERMLLRLPLSDGFQPAVDEPDEDDDLFDDGGGV